MMLIGILINFIHVFIDEKERKFELEALKLKDIALFKNQQGA